MLECALFSRVCVPATVTRQGLKSEIAEGRVFEELLRTAVHRSFAELRIYPLELDMFNQHKLKKMMYPPVN